MFTAFDPSLIRERNERVQQEVHSEHVARSLQGRRERASGTPYIAGFFKVWRRVLGKEVEPKQV
jgi:hypothetical protein